MLPDYSGVCVVAEEADEGRFLFHDSKSRPQYIFASI